MTRIKPDDPKWTAYILGELDDIDHSAVSLELHSSDQSRMLVNDLRFVIEMTRAELRNIGTVEALTPQQREKIRSSANTAAMQANSVRERK